MCLDLAVGMRPCRWETEASSWLEGSLGAGGGRDESVLSAGTD